MSIVLLDTNIVSYFLKDDSRADAYIPFLANNQLAVSFMTVAELFEWAATRRWGAQRRAQLEQLLATYIIVPIDIELCRLWSDLRARQQAKGLTIAPQDAWIAATALRHSLLLITHNPSDFRMIDGLQIQSTIASR